MNGYFHYKTARNAVLAGLLAVAIFCATSLGALAILRGYL